MRAQFTKRAMTAGLGLGALSLLTRPQRAEADTNFTSFAFAATGAPTARTMPDRLSDIVNVKDYGAVGDGVTDDAPAIQAAIDAAFGSASSPHGASSTLNKPLFFPSGNYVVKRPLIFTKVRGARIYGSSTVITGNYSTAVITNGFEYCTVENISFSGPGSGSVGFELDWDGIGSVALQGNVFFSCNFAGGDFGCRIGFSGHGGNNNQFYACNFNNSTTAGLATWASTATGQSIQGGGASSNATAFWVNAGQIASINDVGLSGNSVQDVLMESNGPILIKGTRTESPSFCVFTSSASVAVLDGCSSSATVKEFCHTMGKVIVDSCSSDSVATTVFCSDPSFKGKAYLRGCYFPQPNFLTTFASGGTLAQSI